MAEKPDVIEQHIDWIKFYLRNMRSDNWCDMKLRAERQIDSLAKDLANPRGTGE